MENPKNQGVNDPKKEIVDEKTILSKANRSEEEIRRILTEEYGIEDDEVLDKLVARELAHAKRFSTVIKQKINWREKALAKEQGKQPPAQKQKQSSQQQDNQTDLSSIQERLDLLEIGRLNPDLTAEDVEEIRKYAKGAGISLLEAYNSPLIQAGIQQRLEERKAEKAVAKSGSGAKIKSLSFAEVDLSNPDHIAWLNAKEGRRAKYMKWKANNG